MNVQKLHGSCVTSVTEFTENNIFSPLFTASHKCTEVKHV